MDKETLALRDQLAAIRAKKAKTQDAPAPVPVADPATEALKKELMARFGGSKADAPDTPTPTETRPEQTLSLSDREHQMMRNQKAAEDRAVAAERKVEQLEKSLTFALEHLADFILRQDAKATFVAENYSGVMADIARSHLLTVKDRAALALKLFAGMPTISDSVLLTLGCDQATCDAWRRWRQKFDSKESKHWLEALWKIADHRVNEHDPAMTRFVRACLEAQGLDVDKEIAKIHSEKAREFFAQHPTNWDERGRALQQAGRVPHAYVESGYEWLDLD